MRDDSKRIRKFSVVSDQFFTVDIRIFTINAIVRLQSDFAAALRQVYGKSWHSKGREGGTESSQYFQTAFNAGGKMPYSPHRIDMKQIVWFDPQGNQFAEEFFQNFRPIIDIFQQNSLIDDRNTGLHQPGTGCGFLPTRSDDTPQDGGLELSCRLFAF